MSVAKKLSKKYYKALSITAISLALIGINSTKASTSIDIPTWGEQSSYTLTVDESGIIKSYTAENNTISGTNGKSYNSYKVSGLTGYTYSLINNQYGHTTGYNSAKTYSQYGYMTNNMKNLGNVTYYVLDANKLSHITPAMYSTPRALTGDFIDLTSVLQGGGSGGAGGAIQNINYFANITSITGDFVGNYVTSTPGSSTWYDNNYGGLGSAIESWGFNGNYSNISSINGNFIGNYSYGGGAIANVNNAKIENIKGNFIGNYTSGYCSTTRGGGAIYNGAWTSIGDIKADFQGNSTQSDSGNAFGGAIDNQNVIGNISGNFVNNYSKTSSDEKLALGGAVYTEKNITFLADTNDMTFSGNYTEDNIRGKQENAIFAAQPYDETTQAPGDTATITLTARNGATMTLNDTVDGGYINEENGVQYVDYNQGQYGLTVNGDESSTLNVNNKIINANIEHNNVTTNVKDYTLLNQPENNGINSLTMNSGTLNLGAMALEPLHFENFAMNGGTINISSVKVDLANKVMGRITANNYSGSGEGTINVNSMQLVSDGKKRITPVPFADKSFKNTVKSPVKTALSPVYKYSVVYDTDAKYAQTDENGYFVFKRTGQNPNGSSSQSADAFNPAILTAPVSAQMGAFSAINQSLDYAFEHMDAFSMLPNKTRMAMINENKYAMNRNSLYGYSSNEFTNSRSLWFKPYSMFESVSLKNGPRTSVISYGTLFGGDGELKEMRRGWARIGTAYIGYNGSSISYKGNDIYQNGGLVGGTETWYRNNFWAALTVSAGASVGEMHTMYGQDTLTSLMAGVASKTGYNWEFKGGRFIIQPTWLMSYTFVNTFDYTNKANVRVKSDPLNVIQLHPHFKFIANTSNGWQPYARIGMVWNIMDETKFTANDVRLPEMSIKPYIEYGLGLQRCWNDRFAAWGQAMVRNGGRNGVALTFGFRWALGE